MVARAVTQPDKTGRARARLMYPGEPCEVCGMPYGGRGRVQRHHIDSNRMNNTRSNIAFLCVRHHKDAHKAGDGATGGGPRPRIAALFRDEAKDRAAAAFVLRSEGLTSHEIARLMHVSRESVDRWFGKYPEAAA